MDGSSTELRTNTVNKHESPLLSEAENPTLVSIPIADIEVGDRLRSLCETTAQWLSTSIREHGLVQPIGVRLNPTEDGAPYRLVHGRHRLRAVELLGWHHVLGVIVDLDDDGATLAEGAENIARKPLSAAELMYALGSSKEIYEAQPAVVKHGGDRRSDRWALGGLAPFAEAAADAFGKGKRTVQKYLSIYDRIGGDSVIRCAGTSLDRIGALEVLSQLDQSSRQKYVKRANAGDQISIAELRRANHEFQSALEVGDAVEKKPQSEAIEQLKLQASLQSDETLIEAQAMQRVTQLVRMLEESNALLSPDISAYRCELGIMICVPCSLNFWLP